MMSIACGNLFARNVWSQFVRPDATPRQQTQVSKTMSMLMKLGAVGFVVAVPTEYVINFQLAGGVWILQTLPAVFLGLVLRKLDPRAALAGWAAGTALGTAYLVGDGFASSSADFGLGGAHATMFIGVPALALNLAVTLAATVVLRAWRSGDRAEAVPAPPSLEG
jgi:SSS family solute:Na+ symporter